MRVVELVLGVQGVPLPVLWGPSLHLTLKDQRQPPKSTVLVDSRMFSEPYLDKNKNVLVLDLICLLEG